MWFVCAALAFVFVGKWLGIALSKRLYRTPLVLTVVGAAAWGIAIGACMSALIGLLHPGTITKWLFGYSLGLYVAVANSGLPPGVWLAFAGQSPLSPLTKHRIISRLGLLTFVATTLILSFSHAAIAFVAKLGSSGTLVVLALLAVLCAIRPVKATVEGVAGILVGFNGTEGVYGPKGRVIRTLAVVLLLIWALRDAYLSAIQPPSWKLALLLFAGSFCWSVVLAGVTMMIWDEVAIFFHKRRVRGRAIDGY